MTEQEFKTKLEEIAIRHRQEVTELKKQFALSKVRFKVGDIISNPSAVIEIQRIAPYVAFGGDCVPRYGGKSLTKNLEPKKTGQSFIWMADFGDDRIKLVKEKL